MERVFLRPSHLFCSRGRQTLNVAPPIWRRAKTASTDRPWLLALHSALLLTRPARSPRPLRPARPFSFTLSPPRPLSIFIPHRLRYRFLFLACRGRLLCFASTMPFLLLFGSYHPSANGGQISRLLSRVAHFPLEEFRCTGPNCYTFWSKSSKSSFCLITNHGVNPVGRRTSGKTSTTKGGVVDWFRRRRSERTSGTIEWDAQRWTFSNVSSSSVVAWAFTSMLG